jgi:hypothetical protein
MRAPRARLTAERSVQTPEALAELQAWLDGLRPGARTRGEACRAAGQVMKVWAGADHYVDAVVDGEPAHRVTLFLTRGKWSSRCNCAEREGCGHAYAAGHAWIERVQAGPSLATGTGAVSAPSPAAQPPPPAREAFRAHWSPVIARHLGRTLTPAEEGRLGDLADLFLEFTQSHGILYPGMLVRHGFEYSPPPGAPLYAPALAGWWDSANAPADPWALWQYLAHDHELHGRPIPEVFQPLTRTAGLAAVIAERQVQRELVLWRRALGGADGSPETLPAHPAAAEIAGLRARVRPEGGLVLEVRAGPGKPWRAPARKWFAALAGARPGDFAHLTPPEAALGAALAAECGAGLEGPAAGQALPAEATANLFRTPGTREAFVLPDGRPFAVEPEPLVLAATPARDQPEHLRLSLVTPDGRDAARATVVTLRPAPLYFFAERVWPGPPPTPEAPLPLAALGDLPLMGRLRALGLRLPAALERDVRRVVLRPLVKCWLTPTPGDDETLTFHAQLLARAATPPATQAWSNQGWQWQADGKPPPRRPGEPLLEFDLSTALAARDHLNRLGLTWHDWEGSWARTVGDDFPDEFIAWHAALPAGTETETSPGLANLLGPPLEATVEVDAAPTEPGGRDWFNLSVALRVADTRLTAEEIALLAKARGKWVRLPKQGWRRLEVAGDSAGRAALDRLGLDPLEVLADGRVHTHRVHALQLAAEAELLEARDAQLAAALRNRARDLAAAPPPALPRGLRGTLRPYQREGFHFLAHLSALGLGGVLADDMGLGKTIQTLAWLQHLAETAGPDAPAVRVLVVCPKSVMHGWLVETGRFTPGLRARAFDPAAPDADAGTPGPQLVIANYAQLRLRAAWFKAQAWTAVVLDEGQVIKNPSSQVATVARALPARHRMVLTGTPVENRLTDLWSLFAFAQPGLLGTQTAFQRHYDRNQPEALARLHRRVRHFLLRRTKAEAAPDLPPRTEDELVVALEGDQRRLYEAELKRARAHLLGVDSAAALAPVRFNVLTSLLRLRQICCHPGLVDPAHRGLPSAKLEALLERLEELRDEGHQVLVFSQFVEMLEIIRDRLAAAGIGHLLLTGRTENRAELVDEFQRDRSRTVFLLSLKAAGFGLNLTAASYVILYDPWWNPAVEAQAIDRTHRIGQTQPVVAYRLLAENTVEEKIRTLQREKAALAAAVVHEDSLASILDLDSLRRILG